MVEAPGGTGPAAGTPISPAKGAGAMPRAAPGMALPLLTALALLALLLAGCVTTPLPGDGPRATLVPVGEPIVQDHDHADPALHRGMANVERVAWHSGYGAGLERDLPDGQGFSELAVWRGERDGVERTLVALGRRNGPDGGFSLLDATDPSNITLLASYPGLANYDVEFSTDGLYAFSTTQFLPTQQEGGQPDPAHDQRGVYIVSLADLAAPEPVGFFYPPTRGAHTITYHQAVDGRELLVVNSYDFIPDPSLALPLPSQGANPLAHRTFLTEFLRTPAPRLEVRSVVQVLEPAPGQTHIPHDTYVEEHPVTGDLLLYLAYWDLGCILYDVNDWSSPREVVRLTDFAPSQHADVHYCRPMGELVEGVHVTVTEPELGPTDETGIYAFFDTTDPANPVRLGYWELPGAIVITEGLNFSPHNFDFARGRMYLAHYHGGVWVVDMSTRSLLAQPQSLGYYQASPLEQNRSPNLGPDFWSVFEQDGLLYASDMSAGLQVLRFALD
jgi:hypothetical protein